jgi:hypothetical protein
MDTKATFAKLLQHPPKNAWNAVLTQLLSWSFRRFCVDRLTTDLSGSDANPPLWDSHLSLMADFAPPQFKPHLDNWLAPETLAHVGNLGQLDVIFRQLVSQMDAAVAAEDEATQDKLATLLDEEMSDLLEAWLGTAYAPYSIFPNSEEPDDSIDMTKLNAVNYLLQRQLSITKTVRTTLLSRRMTHRASAIRAATPIKKTRRHKKNVQVRFSPETRDNDSRGEGGKDDEGQRQQREGDKVSDSQEKRDSQGEAPASKQEGNHEHPQPQVHAEPVPPSHTDLTVSGAVNSASIQQDNKEDEKERA